MKEEKTKEQLINELLQLRQRIAGYGDVALIKQVFINLLSNAIKFTRPKEMAVIEVGCRVEENETIYYVKDNGF
jgi:signal transduction histidine kinase